MDRNTYLLAKSILRYMGNKDRSMLKKYPEVPVVHEIIANHLYLNYKLPEIQQAIKDKAKKLIRKRGDKNEKDSNSAKSKIHKTSHRAESNVFPEQRI